jgi:hypothetical protein
LQVVSVTPDTLVGVGVGSGGGGGSGGADTSGLGYMAGSTGTSGSAGYMLIEW